MIGVASGLGTDVVVDDVGDRALIETEFVGELLELCTVGVAQTAHQAIRLMQMFGDVRKREVLDLQPAVDPQPGAHGDRRNG